jgi:hypothetical protein
MTGPSAAVIADRLAAARDRIRAAGGSDSIDIVAVTKGFPAEVVAAAIEAGCTRLGESYAQELIAKYHQVPAWPELHFIGGLQTNKVRMLAGKVDVYDSVDREHLVRELARRVPGARILVQVRATPEEADKAGCPPDQVGALVALAVQLGLHVEGLMCVGPTSGGPQAARLPFRRARTLVDELGLAVCSMGMSGDLDVAVQEGTTQIRIGTALFGERPARG